MEWRMQHAEATGAAAVALNINPAKSWRLHHIVVHITAGPGGSGTLTVTKDAAAGAAYDALLASYDMTSLSDILYQPTRELEFRNGDQINIAWANGGGKTYGVEVYYSVL